MTEVSPSHPAMPPATWLYKEMCVITRNLDFSAVNYDPLSLPLCHATCTALQHLVVQLTKALS
jgi:hypothetical protein